jgi:ABC-type branched-subunit amino acid transport system permease subunit
MGDSIVSVRLTHKVGARVRAFVLARETAQGFPCYKSRELANAFAGFATVELVRMERISNGHVGELAVLTMRDNEERFTSLNLESGV